VDRGKAGSKHHVLVDAHGIPPAATVTRGNRNDVTQLLPLIQAVPPIRGKRGRPRRRPDVIYADRGYDHDKYRRQVRDLGIRPAIARRGTEHGSGLGKNRWVVEAAFALLHWFRRCTSAGRSAPTSTKPSSHSAARSSAGDASGRHSDLSP
jgi:transposase